ncbi:MAG: TetR/AcrR family transcriptional regulator [Alphaproteobacteria bacterium]|nr:TetR/AcrR family transcriptional regulator [Alphaproteobacteria bacterium]MBV9692118.1 TetR/AcrR family transcriptional regulator [Alphaproteobacteria bacterium]
MTKAKATPAEKWALPAQQARSLATRERLLAAAEKTFADKGYDGAKLSDIAAEAGVSVGAVYFRFKDKDALFLGVAETFVQEARARLGEFVVDDATRPLDEVVRTFVMRTAANFAAHRGLFRAIIERGFEHKPVLDIMFALRDEIARSLQDALSARVRDKQALGDAIRVATQMIYGFLLIGILNPHAPTRQNRTQAVKGLADAVVAYLQSMVPR